MLQHQLKNKLPLLLVGFLLTAPLHAELPEIKVGALKFGTVNWQLNVITHHKLDEKNGFRLTVVPLASKNAAAVAIQGKSADVIVGDWFWVMRQKERGVPYFFSPYSIASGGIIVPSNSSLKNAVNLKDKNIGVAGGRIDKSWLIARAFILKQHGFDPAQENNIIYGAPPLLNKLMERGELDAILTFWHYQARLKSQGLKEIIPVQDMIETLGIQTAIPINGWIFSQRFADTHPERISAFLTASRQAMTLMLQNDQEWNRLKNIMSPPDQAAFQDLKKGYRAGIPPILNDKTIQAAKQLFAILKQQGGKELTGNAQTLDPTIFWHKK